MAIKRKQRASKPKTGKAKPSKSKGKRSTVKKVASKKSAPRKLKAKKAVPKAKAAPPSKKRPAAAKPAVAPKAAALKKDDKGKKQLSKKLVDALKERQKKNPTPMELFSNATPPPAPRRGRRPKNLTEYEPSTDEPNQEQERERENLVYDTGIKLGYSVDGDSTTYERSDDYDEELNFDW